MRKSEIHLALMWICDECGKENYIIPTRIESVVDDKDCKECEEEEVEEDDEDDEEEEELDQDSACLYEVLVTDFYYCPKRLKCKFCGAEHMIDVE